jgi:hypothetical protein
VRIPKKGKFTDTLVDSDIIFPLLFFSAKFNKGFANVRYLTVFASPITDCL